MRMHARSAKLKKLQNVRLRLLKHLLHRLRHVVPANLLLLLVVKRITTVTTNAIKTAVTTMVAAAASLP